MYLKSILFASNNNIYLQLTRVPLFKFIILFGGYIFTCYFLTGSQINSVLRIPYDARLIRTLLERRLWKSESTEEFAFLTRTPSNSLYHDNLGNSYLIAEGN